MMSQNPSSPACSEHVIVLDAGGQRLSPCSPAKARAMLTAGRARLVSEAPFTIQVTYAVQLPSPPPPRTARPGDGKRLLLHICCGPCSTYSIRRLREQGFEVSGFWYNPNIHPFAEHERRRECIQSYAERVQLPMIWHAEYEMPTFLRAIAGHEPFGERCPICYRLRLTQTARVAHERAFDAFTTTLLISPYQQQALIHDIGAELASAYGIEFYFENLRSGWAERGRLTHEHDLYQQRYCGCIFSEWEASDPRASTGRPPASRRKP